MPLNQLLQQIEKESGQQWEIIDGSINLLPVGETLEPRRNLILKGVQPDYWKANPHQVVQGEVEYWDIQPFLISEGIPFPPRSFARYFPRQYRLEISNLEANNEILRNYLIEKKVIPK
ncbi:MAG: hypothetical protein HC904_03225 [Blastochloris sp.]|nr:hypothetical protein [Blastochloris sp.]